MKMADPIEDEVVKQVIHPDDRILSESIIDFYVRENITHCKHEVLRVAATLGGHYILVIYLEGISEDNLLKQEWEQFKMLCAEQSVEVTDYDTVLFFDGSIFMLLGK
ncbi:hypothetical protein QVE09_22475 [Paenibacillus sp. ClWae2A]|uniref:hypothetical protein n=1 Tax=Paenibacillus sp. ClWae2A TaxID=3057177 RepID=UPI0028F4E6C0|nr:hypothetical protein [Paenibacillus sp. ClWae2A]MDT9721673.1 hypothetical protein [Paenibacillus sp. ClWae2A]